MKAIVTIFHHRLVVPCAKKALAFKEFIESSDLEDFHSPCKLGVFPVSEERPLVTVETLPAGLVIERPEKRRKATRAQAAADEEEFTD